MRIQIYVALLILLLMLGIISSLLVLGGWAQLNSRPEIDIQALPCM